MQRLLLVLLGVALLSACKESKVEGVRIRSSVDNVLPKDPPKPALLSKSVRLLLDFARKSPCMVVLDPYPVTFRLIDYRDDYGKAGNALKKTNKYVSVHVEIFNFFPNESAIALRLNHIALINEERWKMEYEGSAIGPRPHPLLKDTYLQPGGNTRGWITFDVPRNFNTRQASVYYFSSSVPLRNAESRIRRSSAYKKALNAFKKRFIELDREKQNHQSLKLAHPGSS